jgi:hypothetical protein
MALVIFTQFVIIWILKTVFGINITGGRPKIQIPPPVFQQTKTCLTAIILVSLCK